MAANITTKIQAGDRVVITRDGMTTYGEYIRPIAQWAGCHVVAVESGTCMVTPAEKMQKAA